VAPDRLLLVFAFEIAPTGRATSDRDGPMGADSADEQGKPIVERIPTPPAPSEKDRAMRGVTPAF
jgi:hypothetical protein